MSGSKVPDDIFHKSFVFKANVLPKKSTIAGSGNQKSTHDEQFTSHEIARSNFVGLPLLGEHPNYKRKPGDPVAPSLGCVIESKPSRNNDSVDVLLCIPVESSFPTQDHFVRGQFKNAFIGGVISGKLKDVSLNHGVMESKDIKPGLNIVGKLPIEISLTEEGGREGSSIIDYAWVDLAPNTQTKLFHGLKNQKPVHSLIMLEKDNTVSYHVPASHLIMQKQNNNNINTKQTSTVNQNMTSIPPTTGPVPATAQTSATYAMTAAQYAEIAAKYSSNSSATPAAAYNPGDISNVSLEDLRRMYVEQQTKIVELNQVAQHAFAIKLANRNKQKDEVKGMTSRVYDDGIEIATEMNDKDLIEGMKNGKQNALTLLEQRFAEAQDDAEHEKIIETYQTAMFPQLVFNKTNSAIRQQAKLQQQENKQLREQLAINSLHKQQHTATFIQPPSVSPQIQQQQQPQQQQQQPQEEKKRAFEDMLKQAADKTAAFVSAKRTQYGGIN